MKLLSNCCNEIMEYNTDICPNCGEHCEVIEDNTCPDCNGSGDQLAGYQHPQRIDPAYERCTTCNGTGKVE